jgi:hypothetical protein
MRLAAWVTIKGILLFAIPVAAESNIDPAHKNAWGENIGWTNWRDANGTNDGVTVHDDFLSGYIWCENVGWVHVGEGDGPYANIDDTDYGVNIEGNGDLAGFGWGENIGWINFDTSSLGEDRAGFDECQHRFFGYVWGENVGWINLDDSQHFVGVEACDFDDDGLSDECDGDVDNDGVPNEEDECDFTPLGASVQSDGTLRGDLDGDCDVDLEDFSILQQDFTGISEHCQSP